MCLTIADNLNVHSFSIKPVFFLKRPFWSKIGLFKKISFSSIEDNENQNMFKHKIFIVFDYIFCFFDHWSVKSLV
jgi:hypothetical protein